MQIYVNGESREAPDQSSVLSLLESLGLKSDGTVVQINDNIVERERFDATLLSEGDHIELVRIVGGG